MFVRRRPLLRTAVVGGGAYMAGKRQAQRSAYQAESEAGQDARNTPPESQQSGTAATTTQGTERSVSEQLAQLSALHEQGALTDAEFASAKSRLLGS